MKVEWDTNHYHNEEVEEFGYAEGIGKCCQLVSCFTVPFDICDSGTRITFYRRHKDQVIVCRVQNVTFSKTQKIKGSDGVELPFCFEDSCETVCDLEMTQEEAQELVQWMDPSDGHTIH